MKEGRKEGGGGERKSVFRVLVIGDDVIYFGGDGGGVGHDTRKVCVSV
jgi:hypothetical protein